jgi:hypothetical protein
MAAGKIQNKIESQRETQVNLGRVRFRLTDSGVVFEGAGKVKYT